TSGVITTVAGDGTTGRCDLFDPDCGPSDPSDPPPPPDLGDGGPATAAHLNNPQSVDVDSAGNLYIADWANHRIRKVDTSGTITTVAGDGTTGGCDWFDPNCDPWAPVTNVGDGGPATAAHLEHPYDMAADPAGNLYIADSGHARVRKVDTSGVITTVAGTGVGGHSGDGGPATSAQLTFPTAVAVQGYGNLFISNANSTIRRVDAGGTIDTVAGTPGSPGSMGDGGYGPFALLRSPYGLDLDPAGNLYIADAENHRIRRLETSHLWIDSSPDPTTVGQSFTYDLSVSGLPATADGVKLTATLAPEVGFVGVTASQGSCGRSGSTVTCALGTLAPGATARAKITATALGAGIIPITATVGADNPDAIPGNRTATGYSRISHRDCGRVITSSTRLREDLGPCAGNGIILGADNITLNLGGRRVFGFPGPSDGTTAGIRLPHRSHVQVVNGTVSGFDAGVFLNGGGSNTVANLTVRDNIGPDNPFGVELGDGIVLFDSASNRIANNVVTNNGIFDGIGVLGGDADGNAIVANTVTANVGPGDGGPAGQGIIVNAAGLGVNEGQVITGTKIEGNVVRGSGSGGIANINNVDAQILNNIVEGNGLTNAQGNGIGVQLGPSRVVQDAATRVLVQKNEVHGNGQDGIHVRRGAGANRILDNNAANNNALATPWYRYADLRDHNSACGDNVWSGNTWGTGFYSPACTAAGGSGPTLQAEPEVYGESACYDDFDNDLDGLVDHDDAGCQPPPPTEGPNAPQGSCSDGLDNDEDTLVDA
ncbi:MAG TPA: right-handed parallel beta-helix repeat-containing protein, partial [Acidimicrobiales bacterium]|nr:right-handed parallel beta-helix repeat-containing protein [Acidimicrobiales bacterium]